MDFQPNNHVIYSIMGGCIVLVLLLIVYFTYPDSLLSIPEYKALSDELQNSKDDLIKLKNVSDEYSKIINSKYGNQGEELMRTKNEIFNLQRQIEEGESRLKKSSLVISDLINSAKSLKFENKEKCNKLISEANVYKKNLNDKIITEFDLSNKELSTRIKNIRDSIINLLRDNSRKNCTQEKIAEMKKELRIKMDRLRETPSEGRQICSGEYIKSMGYSSYLGSAAPPDIVAVVYKIDELMSFTIQDNFCDKDKNLIVDKLETYIADVFIGMCNSDDLVMLMDKNINYYLSKPLTYLK